MWKFFSSGNRVTPVGEAWTGESIVAVLGTINANLRGARPIGSVRLRVVSILGTVNVSLPAQCSASVNGMSILGTTNGWIDHDDAAVRVSYFNLLGTVNIGH
jgi:hypothetical protein